MNDQISARAFPPPLGKERSDWPKAPTAMEPFAGETGALAIRGASAPTADRVSFSCQNAFMSGRREQPQFGDPSPGESDLLTRILNSLYWDLAVPRNHLSVMLERGWVTISGDVDYAYQKSSAEADVRRISGVKGVMNAIEIKLTGAGPAG